jgi:predicted DNA-binding antitoxin AbrB/MazE fold protein
MHQQVTAIFENGMLRPLAPVDLQEQQLVSLLIEKVAENGDHVEAAESTLFEVFDEVGLVGCIKDAPNDLSTNPKYLQGFGTSGN